MPFLKPLMPQKHTVPGFRLGPDLPSPITVEFTCARHSLGQPDCGNVVVVIRCAPRAVGGQEARLRDAQLEWVALVAVSCAAYVYVRNVCRVYVVLSESIIYTG